ncbi:cytosine-specific DNA modification methyltransferase [Mycoplasma crocodyli MP145]|uniref:Cytosine-specific DNA modification methyltransferase n=2 Tax=Mycoplasma TaxID=2093 RepID=D5E653_MYCCM|nr:cytosine-specific DNA modification methyltransferase [Mycoplasma crocodyli MP145]
MSITNPNLIKQLSELPNPDIIFASPPCESWSGADCSGRMFKGIDNVGLWKVANSKYYDEYLKTCHPVKRRYFQQKETGRLIGEGTVGGSISIIKHFKPKVWVIENPATSKSWEFQEEHWNFSGKLNKTYYSSYDENYSLKPTIFKSNLTFNLKTERRTANNSHMSHGSYARRSSIPDELIKDILEQSIEFINKEDNHERKK